MAVEREALLEACKLAYRKHVLGDESVGWQQLGDVLASTLAEAMGDDAFVKWLESAHPNLRKVTE